LVGAPKAFAEIKAKAPIIILNFIITSLFSYTFC
jgi:hypothetical protein